MSTCMCTCVVVSAFVCTYVLVCVRAHVYECVRVHECMLMSGCVYTCLLVSTCVCVYVCAYECMHVHVCMCAREYMMCLHVCICECMLVSACTCMCVFACWGGGHRHSLGMEGSGLGEALTSGWPVRSRVSLGESWALEKLGWSRHLQWERPWDPWECVASSRKGCGGEGVPLTQPLRPGPGIPGTGSGLPDHPLQPGGAAELPARHLCHQAPHPASCCGRGGSCGHC